MGPSRARVRSFREDEWPTYRRLRLQSLAESPDAFGSTLAREESMDDDHWRDRLGRGVGSEANLPLVAEMNEDAAGLAWGRLEPDPECVRLYQMWVAPPFRRFGLAAMLLETVIRWGREADRKVFELSVSSHNLPAVRLYQRAGFEPFGTLTPLRRGSEFLSQTMRLTLDPR